MITCIVYINSEFGGFVMLCGFLSVLFCSGGQFVTSSEDGSVKIWDLRDKQMTSVFVPYKEERLSRAHLGKWIGAAALSDNWLVIREKIFF